MDYARRRLSAAALTLAAVAVSAAPAPAAPTPTPATQPGLKAEYFDYTDLTGKVAERIDPTVDFDWNQDEPVPGVGDTFSARWSGVVTPLYTESYEFITRSDDGVRLWVDGQLLIDDWVMHSAAERSGEIELEAGKAYDIKLEYYDGYNKAVSKLHWRSHSQSREIIPASALATQAPGETPAIDLPKPGGVPATVVPAGDLLPPETVLPGIVSQGTPVVSYGGPLPPPAPPITGVTFNAVPEGEGVLVRRPADGQLIPLVEGASLPVGTHVDVREGGVDLQTAPAVGVGTATQEAHFEGGMFKVTQSKAGRKLVNIDLLHGEFAEVCGPLSSAERRAINRRRAVARAASTGPVARAAGNKRVLRRLWGKGKGRFRTKGRHAAATVRGTSWSIADRCDSTAVRVHEGIVDVENLLTGAVVTLRSGERHSVSP